MEGRFKNSIVCYSMLQAKPSNVQAKLNSSFSKFHSQKNEAKGNKHIHNNMIVLHITSLALRARLACLRRDKVAS